MTASIDRKKLADLRRAEDAAFAERTPRSAELRRRASRSMPNAVPMTWMTGLYRFPAIFATRGAGAYFEDADANRYCDFNVCDLSMTMGYGPPAIVKAVSRQVEEGAHFLLATEAAIDVTEELARRIGLPFWQFTLSASGANVEVMRIARALTGRRKIAIFGGHYHGHIDETLVKSENGRAVPEALGTLQSAANDTVIVPFNDLEALEAVLAKRDVALVLTEPVLTNCLLVQPQPGVHAGIRDLTRRYGTLLCLDEAHTFSFAYGGLVRAWQLDGDFVVLGKGLGTGVSFALYGMTDAIAQRFSDRLDIDIGPRGIATGGTTYASAIATATARAALTEVLTPDNYARIEVLGERLADGLDALFKRHGLPWKAFRLGPRSGFCLFPTFPLNGSEAARSMDIELIDTRRVFMANRGVWDAIASAGPQASFAHTAGDIDHYVSVADAFLSHVVGLSA